MAAAIALERAGFDPRVFERAPELSEIGAGLGLTANAMKAMGYLGAAEFVRHTGVPVDATEWRSLDDGSRHLHPAATARRRSTTASSTCACTAPICSRRSCARSPRSASG